jgi:hypothetical protein
MHPRQKEKLKASSSVPPMVSAAEADADDQASSTKVMGKRGLSSIPFSQRPTCTITEGCTASGLGRSTLYSAMRDGRLRYSKVGKRTLLNVSSLLQLIGAVG